MPEPPKRWDDLKHHPHREGFERACQEEYQALLDKETLKVVPLDKVRLGLGKGTSPSTILPLMWVFGYKWTVSGYFDKYKARICVRGDLQIMSQKDTYAATLAFRIFRSLMAMTAAFGLKTRQLDAIAAFLNTYLDVEYIKAGANSTEADICIPLKPGEVRIVSTAVKQSGVIGFRISLSSYQFSVSAGIEIGSIRCQNPYTAKLQVIFTALESLISQQGRPLLVILIIVNLFVLQALNNLKH